jgi:hypothetical protein
LPPCRLGLRAGPVTLDVAVASVHVAGVGPAVDKWLKSYYSIT